MEILDPDLWNDDGTPKRPSKLYIDGLEEAQRLEAIDPSTSTKRESERRGAYLSYARARRETLENQPAAVGDVVHFWDEETGACRAAVVAETEGLNHNCELHVFIPKQAAQFWYAVHSEHKAGAGEGTWHWPCGGES